jgi:hypothetical protein
MNGIQMDKTLVDKKHSPYSDNNEFGIHNNIDIPKLDLSIPDINSHELRINEIKPIQKYYFFDSDDDEKSNNVKLLSEYISNIVNEDKIVYEKYSITKKMESIIRLLLESKSFFLNTELFFISVMNGNKIDVNKVPFIMDFLIELYKSLKLKLPFIDVYLCGEVLKLLFSVTVHENIIRISSNKEAVISCFHNIIEMSVYISNINSPRISIFSCIGNLFRR